MATALGMLPVMTFVENEFQMLALFNQNELHQVQPGDEAEIALETYPGRIIKASVNSIVWAQGQGQIPMSSTIPLTGFQALPPGRFAVRLDIAPRGPRRIPRGGRGRARRDLHAIRSTTSRSSARSCCASIRT